MGGTIGAFDYFPIFVSIAGVDFNSTDGTPAKLVFLLLMPPRAHDQEVRILAAIARAAIEASSRQRLLGARTLAEVVALLSENAPRRQGSMRPRSASLADI